MKCVLNSMPINITTNSSGESKPQTGQNPTMRSSRQATLRAVAAGIMLGQYTSQGRVT